MWFLWGIICQRFQIETTHQRNARGKKAVFMSYVWPKILFLYQIERPYWKKSQVGRLYCVRGLKEHTNRVHEGTKPFLCDSCEESFAKHFKLKPQIKGMQGGKKPFSCPMCCSQFYFSTTMQDHIIKNHKSQDLTMTEVWKNTLVEFMKAQRHSYVILVRNHLQRFQVETTHQRNGRGKKAVFMSYVWLTILFLYHNARP